MPRARARSIMYMFFGTPRRSMLSTRSRSSWTAWAPCGIDASLPAAPPASAALAPVTLATTATNQELLDCAGGEPAAVAHGAPAHQGRAADAANRARPTAAGGPAHT